MFSQADKALFNAFWNNNDRKTPIHTKRPRWLVPKCKGLSINLPKAISPADLAPPSFRDHIEKEYSYFQEFEDGMFWIANPINLPYMELMWGAPLLYRENGFWPGQPVPKDIPVIIKEAQRNGTVRAEDQWADLYIEYCRYLADISKGRFAVGQSVLRGPSDILLTLRGSEQGVLDYYDRGDEVHALFESYTDSFCALMDRMFSVLDPLEGGYCIAAMDQLWAPGRFVRLQEDAYSLLNPDIYREFLLPYNRRICKTFDYTVFHLHSAFTELLDDLLTIEELRAVQVTVDSKGPKLSDLTEPLLKIQNAGKKLVLRGEFSGKDLNFLSCLLNPSGVFITTMIETKEGKTNENQKKAV